MKHIASVSFGKDSLAMLILIVKKGLPLDEVVFYDTGMEFDAIYKIRDKVKKWLNEIGIKYMELKPTKPFKDKMYNYPHKSRKGDLKQGYGWCGGLCRWGTSEKVKTLDPCQMPLEVMKNIIGILPKDAIIIDPFMGSGTTGVACKELGRDFIGIEIDKEYFDIASERIGKSKNEKESI